MILNGAGVRDGIRFLREGPTTLGEQAPVVVDRGVRRDERKANKRVH